MSDDTTSTAATDESAEPNALLSRLRVIEQQPLESRADALAQLHDELKADLEAGDPAKQHA